MRLPRRRVKVLEEKLGALERTHGAALDAAVSDLQRQDRALGYRLNAYEDTLAQLCARAGIEIADADG
jgi:hypothetical protein